MKINFAIYDEKRWHDILKMWKTKSGYVKILFINHREGAMYEIFYNDERDVLDPEAESELKILVMQ